MSCSCGDSCRCGSNCSCNGRSMYAGMEYTEKSTSESIVLGVAVAPAMKMYSMEGSEMSTESGNGCKCGSSCSCDPCNC